MAGLVSFAAESRAAVLAVGFAVGFAVGDAVRSAAAVAVAVAVGSAVGFAVGFAVGLAVGFAVGFAVGLAAGARAVTTGEPPATPFAAELPQYCESPQPPTKITQLVQIKTAGWASSACHQLQLAGRS